MSIFARLLGGQEKRAASPYVDAFLRGDDMPNAWGAGGRVVTQASALSVVAVYACVRVIAETVASLPLVTYRRLEPRGRERATSHPLYWLLHDRPNPEMSRMTFWEAMIGQAALRGTSYAEIQRDGDDRPIALWPLRADRMQVDRTTSGQLFWRYRLPNGQEKPFGAREILSIPGFGGNGVTGYSPMELHAEAIGLALDTQSHAARFFQNDSTPGGVLQGSALMSDEAYERLKSSWEAAHRGVGNAHRFAILEEGFTWQQIGLSGRDSQLIEQRRFSVEEIARLHRVPLHLIQELSHATFTNIEHQSIDFVVHTVRPWAERVEQAIERCLLAPADQRTYFVEHLVDGLLRGDIQTRFAAYSVSKQNGWNSANDIREMENQNPIPADQGGDTYMVQLNMAPAGQIGENLGGGGGSGGQRAFPTEHRAVGGARVRQRLAERFEPLFRAAAQRAVNREVVDVGAAARRFLNRRDAESFEAWLRDYYADFAAPARQMAGVMATYAEMVLEDAAAEIGSDDAEMDAHRALLDAYLEGFGTEYSASSLGQLQQVLADAIAAGDDQAEAVATRLDEWQKKRAGKIAAIETIALAGALVLSRWRRGGIRRIRWVTLGSRTCRFSRRLNGQVVGIQEAFANAGDTIEGDEGQEPLKVHRKTAHPPIHGFCKCGLQPETGVGG